MPASPGRMFQSELLMPSTGSKIASGHARDALGFGGHTGATLLGQMTPRQRLYELSFELARSCIRIIQIHTSAVRREVKNMTFIRTVPPEEASGTLREIYQYEVETCGYVPNYSSAFSLRPDTYAAYRALSAAIKAKMPLRRFELVTMAAAGALRCSY